jgi:hypothetical protein
VHLIFEADDTLWENNILFDRSIADFTDWIEVCPKQSWELRTGGPARRLLASIRCDDFSRA